MTTWRYRVRRQHGFYEIVEFYEDVATGRGGMIEGAISPAGTSELELIQDIRAMLKAFDEPVIEVDE